MKEFRLLDYCTEYSCKGDVKKRMGKEACFGYVFNNIADNFDVTYTIKMYKGTENSKNNQNSNACLVNRKFIRNHIKQLNDIYPVEFKIKSDENCYKVFLHIKDAPANFHKYALTWVRYIYEFPYNVLIIDAHKLKELKQFRFESISNLMNRTISCYCDPLRTVHQIPNLGLPYRMKKAVIKEKLKTIKNLNDLYLIHKENIQMIPRKLDGYTISDIEYWDLFFEDRKQVYLKAQ